MSVSHAIRDTWGEADRRAEFVDGGWTIEVLKYEAASTPEGVVIYATASSGPSASGHWSEFILGLDTAHDEVAASLASLSLYTRSTAPLHHGDTVPIGGPPWPGSAFDRFLVMQQVEPVLGPFDIDERHVEFMTVVPIYPSELPTKASLGADGFLEELRRNGIAPWQGNRRALSRDVRER
jgi:hypothetical protein